MRIKFIIPLHIFSFVPLSLLSCGLSSLLFVLLSVQYIMAIMYAYLILKLYPAVQFWMEVFGLGQVVGHVHTIIQNQIHCVH